MYRDRLWTMRQYAGFSSPEDTNERYRYLIEHVVRREIEHDDFVIGPEGRLQGFQALTRSSPEAGGNVAAWKGPVRPAEKDVRVANDQDVAVARDVHVAEHESVRSHATGTSAVSGPADYPSEPVNDAVEPSEHRFIAPIVGPDDERRFTDSGI